MVCNHLKELYELCETHQLKLSGSDLIRIVCKTCDEHESCPSMLMDEYEARYKPDDDDSLSPEKGKSATGDQK